MTVPPVSERRTLGLLAAMQFVNIVDFMIIMPLAPPLTRLLHLSPAQFSLLVSAYTFAAAISGLVMARWMDAFSRKKLLLFMFAGFAVGTLLCALAGSFPVLLLARVVAGTFGGVVSGITQAYVADILPPERRGWGIGVIMTAFSLASVFGVPMGIWLASLYGWRTPFMFIVLLALVIGSIAARWLPDIAPHPSSGNTSLWDILLDRGHWLAFALTLTLMMAGFSVIPHISPFLSANLGISDRDLAWFYLTGGATTLITARLIGKLADRIGKFPTFRLVALLSMLPILIVTHLQHGGMWLYVPVFAAFMVLVSGRFIPAQALISMSVPPQRRGRFMSVNTSVQQFGSGLAANVSGAMLARDGAGHLLHYEKVGYLAVIATALAVLLAGLLDRRRVRAGVDH